MLQGLLGFSKLFPPVNLYYTGITILPVWETYPPKVQVDTIVAKKSCVASCIAGIVWICELMARNSFGCLVLGLLILVRSTVGGVVCFGFVRPALYI